MAKKFEGLDNLIQPTTDDKKTEEPKKGPETTTAADAEYVNSNIPLLKEQHTKLRILAMLQQKTLKQLFTEMIDEYLKNHEVPI